MLPFLRFPSTTLAALLAFGFVLLAEPARAGEGEGKREDEQELAGLLEEDVVSAPSKAAEAAKDAPATTSTLTAADIRRYGIRSLDEAIDFLGMGLVTQNPLHSVEIGGRGVLLTSDYGNHVVLTVDGHVMNEGWGQTAYYEQGAAIPIELIDHIEIVLGPGSVLYGGNAMLAVVNVVTKRAAAFKGLRLIGEGSLSPAQSGSRFTSFALGDLGSSYRLAAGAGHELTLLGKRAELTLQVERYQQHGPPLSFAPQQVTNDDGSPKNFGSRAAPGVWGGQARNSYDTSVNSAYGRLVLGDFTFMSRAATYERSTPYTNYINQPFGNFDDGRSGELDRWLSFDVQYNKQLSRRTAVLLHGFADSYDYQQRVHSDDGADCSVATAGPCKYTSLGVSRWAGLTGHVSHDWFGDDRLTSLLGASVTGRYVGAKADSQDEITGQQMGSVGARTTHEVPWAAFFQQRWSPAGWVHLNGGARFDEAPRGGSYLSPRAAAAFDVWSGGTAKAIYSQAFRPPTFFEAYYEVADQIPAPNLRAEREKSVEGSVEQRFGRHKLLMGVFRTWWSDMIALRLRDDGLAQYQNVASIDNYGYNARIEGAFGRFRYGLSATGAHSRRTTPDGETPLPVAPQVFGNARVSYDLPDGWPTVAIATHAVGPRLADRALDGEFPVTPAAPAQVRFKLALTGAVPHVPKLTYRVGLDLATASRSAYVAGPIQFVDPTDPNAPRAALAPVNRLTAFTGLQYEF